MDLKKHNRSCKTCNLRRTDPNIENLRFKEKKSYREIQEYIKEKHNIDITISMLSKCFTNHIADIEKELEKKAEEGLDELDRKIIEELKEDAHFMERLIIDERRLMILTQRKIEELILQETEIDQNLIKIRNSASRNILSAKEIQTRILDNLSGAVNVNISLADIENTIKDYYVAHTEKNEEELENYFIVNNFEDIEDAE